LEESSLFLRSVTNKHNAPFRLPKLLEVLLVILVILELVAPFVTRTYGIDACRHVLWIDQFLTLNSQGILIPTWVPNGFQGFGSITFYFYPPFTYVVTSAIHLLTGISNPVLLYQITSVLATIASFFSTIILLRNLRAPRYQALLGAALYAFAPLRMFELYNRGTLSSHLAYIFLPLLCLGFISCIRNTGPAPSRNMLLLAVSAALLALTSVPITMATAICIVIVIPVTWKQWTRSAIKEIAMATLLAASLAAYHYTSVLAAEPYARLGNLYFSHGAEDIRLWFHPGAGTYNLLLIYATIGMIGAAFGMARWKKELLTPTERMAARVGLLIAIFVLFLDYSPLSAWLWNSQLFMLIQIPWRFYPTLLLFAAILVGIASSIPLKRAAKGILWIGTLGLMLPVGGVLSSWHSMDWVPSEDDAYAPNSPIRSENIQSTFDSHQKDQAALTNLQQGESLRKISSTPYEDEFETGFLTSHTVTFHRFYWPYWHLYVSGREIPSRPDSIGRAIAILPAGHYSATWQLERTPLECAGLWISGISWSGVLMFWGIGLIRRRVTSKRTNQRDPDQSHSSPPTT
jgi:hypothetical protein